MLESETIAVAQVPGGLEFVLARQDEDWVVRVGGRTLMSSRMHDSEEALAEEALERADNPRRVLVGGLGLGFTLRAVLDRVSADARVTIAELVPELVDWNRTHLAALHDHALKDPRCSVVVGDVFDTLRRPPEKFDVILLDVDNGPVALSHAQNQRLYGDNGVRVCREALNPGGILAVWSAGPSPRFEKRLVAAGFEHEVLRVAARIGSRARHVVRLCAAYARLRGRRATRRRRQHIARGLASAVLVVRSWRRSSGRCADEDCRPRV